MPTSPTSPVPPPAPGAHAEAQNGNGKPGTLRVAFLWHMHQPSYRDPVSGDIAMPWVRMHGAKDYTDMLAATRAVPAARVTVNWVPGLCDQLDAMAAHDYGARERFWRLTETPATALQAADIEFIRAHFFSLAHATMVDPYPRYRQLRDLVRSGAPLDTQELRDLQLWFNLAWCGVTVRADPAVAPLVAKGRDFAESDKRPLLEAMRRAGLAVVQGWRQLAAEQVELSVSPYYHPILPLLIDSDTARKADRGTPLPAVPFRFRGDAEMQIARAVARHRERFGAAPAGMWPSEGGVSAAVVDLARAQGIRWLATDEALLWKSLGSPAHPHIVDRYQPWELSGVTLFFRDHELSDRIGFVYANWAPERAWADFVGRLTQIHAALGHGDGVVLVALDGENCWEEYPGGVTRFLPGLYEAIAGTPGLALTTLSEAAAQVPARPLAGVSAGSWIDGTFRTWLGDPVKNYAWELLQEARQAVQQPLSALFANGPAGAALADLVMRAEASDWWWWFGEGHSSSFDREFDALFRSHLAAIWRALGRPVPDALMTPLDERATVSRAPPKAPELGFGGGGGGEIDLGLSRPRATTRTHTRPQTQRMRPPSALLTPELDGQRSWYFKWLGAGEIPQSFGSMHRAESALTRLFYANDLTHLYLRLDANDAAARVVADGSVVLHIEGVHADVTLALWPALAPVEAALGTVLEARIPLATAFIHALPGRVTGTLELRNAIGDTIERFPGTGRLELALISAADAALDRGV